MEDWEKFEGIVDGDATGTVRDKQTAKRMMKWNIIIGAGGVIGFTAAAIYVWMNAPPVGGEWWFYLRFIVTIVGGIIGLAVGKLVALLLLVFGALLMAFARGDRS